MGNYMLLYRGVCLDDPPRFYVNPAKMSMPKVIALEILCILTSLELDAFYSIDILLINNLIFFIFIELQCIIKLYVCSQTSSLTW
jgi:hypothetical protein